ncbi:MAG: CDGSH iron-sulfur domain-containing protein [Turneriella sp.]|nr:CDGSH iron-sulfur domain-containing protein [Leptospiraceae bacterium]MCX7633122.1 CDGSH iron-sulfur domain-containing protein [Turneriella sp.]
MAAHIAAKQPAQVELEAGKSYFWCSCGHSQKQPFCDGSHNALNKSLPEGEKKFAPLKFTAEKSGTHWLCQCKQTGKPPFCDGTHRQL